SPAAPFTARTRAPAGAAGPGVPLRPRSRARRGGSRPGRGSNGGAIAGAPHQPRLPERPCQARLHRDRGRCRRPGHPCGPAHGADAAGVRQMTELHTPRLLLRPANSADAPAFTLAVGEFAVARHLTALPWPYTLAMAIDWLRQAPPVTPERAMFIIEHADHGLVGCITLADELGFW